MKLTPMFWIFAAAVCAAGISSVHSEAQLSSNAKVFASGLAGPRGLKFGADGNLYIAEAGFGGTRSTIGDCEQVPSPIGPYTGGNTGRISKVDKSGKRTTVATGFPSSQSADATKDTSSVADVAFLNGQLYAVLAGGGCSHGNSTPNALVHVDVQSGAWKIVANLSEFLKTHPAKYPNPPDFEPDGTFYSLIVSQGKFYTVEPNHGQVFSITPSGGMREEIDISEAQGHIVPTSITEHEGTFYVGNLGVFPITPDASKILTLSTNDTPGYVTGLNLSEEMYKLKVAGSRAGFATIVGLEINPSDGLMYALELSPAVGYPTPGLGKVVRVNKAGEIEDVATGLSVPTAMTFGPDGKLYVSNWGAAPPGDGQIVEITVPVS